ncbi:MAG: hypothetical protein AAGG44_19935 [Planctomycetota bacterium]
MRSRPRLNVVLPALILATVVLGSARAHSQEAGSASKGTKIYVAFRMENWKSKHIHDNDVATKHAATLKQLGCEVKTADHNGHMDVSCRTVFWKSLALDSSEQAKQWIAWLQQSGFETIHGHAVGSQKQETKAGAHREAIQYRLADWKSRHIHDNDELAQLLALYRGLGCEVQTSGHNGHTDVKARCSKWMEIELSSHEAAHAWEKFLGDMGFETKHEH